MPCRYDDTPTASEASILHAKIRFLEACLCMLMTAIDNELTDQEYTVLDNSLDEKESGVTKDQLWEWFRHHQVKDRERKERERQRALRELEEQRKNEEIRTLANKALAKLTPEEIAALNLSPL